MTEDDFLAAFPVSRETADKLRAYADLLKKWQPKINLVGPATIPELWRRHFLDSAQLFPHLPAGPVLDLGSGAGFPGLVLAILRGEGGDPVHLAESDVRKGAFLREAARITKAPAIVQTSRIEALKPFEISAITARALAPVGALLTLAEPFLAHAPKCLFLKGEKLEDELTEAAKDWKMTLERIPSVSDPNGFILSLKEVRRGQ
ncbi:MAG TPA: 16S rRNA (guanine(527)-N(7))-methyltransferase RsmG [Magnetospirillaceae bacterium]|nr:16S rRNA (guanine(527)-N(7))-methyltransferase RsmG [Magnetospirillaceae bacterium]